RTWHADWRYRCSWSAFSFFRKSGRQGAALRVAPGITSSVLAARCGLFKRVSTLRRAGKDLCSFLLHQLLLCGKVGIGIHLRYEIPIALQQACCQNASTQTRPEAFGYGNIRQIRLLENLAADPSFLSKDAFELHHEASLFVQDLKDLFGRGCHTVKIVGDNVRRARGHSSWL